MIKRLLSAAALCLTMTAVHAVPVTVGVETDAYGAENGWLIFSGAFDALTTDLTTDTVAIEGLTVTGALSFQLDGLASLSSLTTVVDLAAGIYTFFGFDDFGDGMTCPDLACFPATYNGGFTLDLDGTEIYNNLGATGYGQIFFEFEVIEPPSQVAEPPALALLGLGLLAAWVSARRRAG